MKALKYILLTTCLLTLLSCKKFLDTQPQDFISPVNYYKTEAQLNTALNAVYDPLGQSTLYGDRMLGRMGLDADEGYFTRSTELRGVSVYDVSVTDPYVSNFWRDLYDGINRANLLLENINQAEDISDESRNAIKGEALFLRAYYHYMLVSNFGDVPLVLATLPNADNTDIPRTPAKEVYDQIIADMTEAESLVKPIQVIGFGGRVSKSAVRGMLARVCLSAAGHPVNDVSRYNDAREWALKVITDTEAAHALNPDYSRIFINYAEEKYDIKESIWEVEFWGNRLDAYREGGRVGNNNGIRSTNEALGYTYGFIGTTGKLFNLYQQNPDNSSPDLRRDWSIAPFRWNNTTKVPYTASQVYERDCGKFRREYEVLTPKGKNDTPQNFPLLRFSDVLLMFAEAENQLNGPTIEAYNAINQVRRRAYGKLLPGATDIGVADLSGLTKEGFLAFIKDERSRELSFECLRKRDLVRWNDFLPAMKEALSQFDTDAPSNLKFGRLAFNNATERDELWPIPSREFGLNRKLTQNEGW